MPPQVATASTGSVGVQMVAIPSPLPQLSGHVIVQDPRVAGASPPPPASELSYREVFYITGDLPDGFRLRYALPVMTRIEAGEYVAEQPQLNLHAFGETSIEAILSLRDEIVGHCALLEEMGDRLSVRLMRQREMLRQVLSPPDA